jgi:uncharacterized protein YjlB
VTLFTGKCKKPEEFSKADESVKIAVEQILNGVEINIPRRTLSINDPEGRAPSDPLFEGFRYTPREGSVSFSERVRRGGILGMLGFRRNVQRTLQWSSHSDATTNTVLPLVLGRAQMQLINFASADTGREIQFLAIACEGPVAGFVNLRSVTPGLTLFVFAEKLGFTGGTGTQINDDVPFIASGIYSRTAYVRAKATGTAIDVDDAAPDTVGIVLGFAEIPIPDETGAITRYGFSDNGVLQARWILGNKNFFGLDDAWFDDAEHFKEAAYCDHILVDQAHSDLVQFPASQSGIAGTSYRNYNSTGNLSPGFLRRSISENPIDLSPFSQQTDYNFYTNVPANGDGTLQTPATNLRRRFTSNVSLNKQMKAIDFIYDVLFPAFNGYLIQKASGVFTIRSAKPEDFGFVQTENQIGAREIHASNINPFVTRRGRILIGANLKTSEVRQITGYRYDTGVSVPITATGGVTTSSAALTGGTNTAAPNVVLTVTAADEAKTLNINGFPLTYNPSATDDTVTVAGFLAGLINSHNELNKRIKAVWNKNATVTVSSRIGYLTVDSPLNNAHLTAIANPAAAPTATLSAGTLAPNAYQISYSFVTVEGETLTGNVLSVTVGANQKIDIGAIPLPERVLKVNWYASIEPGGIRRHLARTNGGEAWSMQAPPKITSRLEPVTNSTGEEMHRIAMAFCDKGNPASNLKNSNILSGTFRFPLGGKAPSTNRISLEYRSAVDDFALTKLGVNDTVHQLKVKKTNTREINGAAIDNYHQAYRIANQALAKLRDGDVFVSGESDGEALLLEEGDVIAITDESGRYINFTARVEDITVRLSSGFPTVSFVARKYRRAFYDDQVTERLVPLPVVTNSGANTEQGAAAIFQKGAATNSSVTVGVTNYSTNATTRRVQVAPTNTFTTGLSDFTHSAAGEIGLILTAELNLIRQANLTVAETKFVRVAHSSNGETFGAWSNVLTISYPAADGTGGTPPQEFPPSGGGGGTDGGFGGGHKINPDSVA